MAEEIRRNNVNMKIEIKNWNKKKNEKEQNSINGENKEGKKER